VIFQQPQGMCEALLTLLIIVTVNPIHMLDRYGFCHLSGWREVKMSKQIRMETVSFPVFR